MLWNMITTKKENQRQKRMFGMKLPRLNICYIQRKLTFILKEFFYCFSTSSTFPSGRSEKQKISQQCFSHFTAFLDLADMIHNTERNSTVVLSSGCRPIYPYPSIPIVVLGNEWSYIWTNKNRRKQRPEYHPL